MIENAELVQSYSQYAKKLVGDMSEAVKVVYENTGQAMRVQKENYDKKLHGKVLKETSLVWLYTPLQDPTKSRKLHRPWTGPCEIVEDFDNSTFRIKREVRNVEKEQNVHFNRLKLYNGLEKSDYQTTNWVS